MGPSSILEVGVVARRALRDGAKGRVGAVFERSLYVVLDGQWICLIPTGRGSGPLNALYASLQARGGPRLQRGDPVRVIGCSLVAVESVLASFAGARVWRPVMSADWTIDSLDRGLKAFDGARDGPLPRDALGLIDQQGPGVALPEFAAAAHLPAQRLAEIVRRAFVGGLLPEEDHSSDCKEMLGLGPGLTPSGDDVVGGAMVTLTMLGHCRVRDALWASLREHARERTSDLSLAHLEAAAEGHGAAALHTVLASLLTGAGERLPADLAMLDAVGHSSGWDGLAGALLVLRAYRETRLGHSSGRRAS
jgi:hypothetical protein